MGAEPSHPPEASTALGHTSLTCCPQIPGNPWLPVEVLMVLGEGRSWGLTHQVIL